jgi:hypothetical protein
MTYMKCTFLDCYSAFFPLHAYFLPTYKNGEALVLGKVPYLRLLSLIDCKGGGPTRREWWDRMNLMRRRRA